MATSASKAASQNGPKAVPPPGAGDAPAASGKKKIIALAVLIPLLILGAGGAWFYYSGFAVPNHAPHAAAQQPPRPPVFMTMEMFTVNLQSEDNPQFLQIGMTLQVTNQEQVDLIKLHMPQVRNRLLLLLSSKKPAEILSVEGKKKLASEILSQLKQPFTPQSPEPGVTDVFFTSFVVQ